MATTGRPDEPAPPASDVADSCRDAGLVGLVGTASGDALAAVGLLGRTLAQADAPFQARLVPADATADLGATEADYTVAIGRTDPAADAVLGAPGAESTAEQAYAIGSALGEADPSLGLAAALAADADPGGRIREDATAAGIDRRPGIAVPTTDLADGLAHTTLVHAPFSGDRAAAADAVADLELGADPAEDDHRRLASLVALAVAETDECPPQATGALERVLHPFAGGPLVTVGGYADVLDALARTVPGVGIAVAIGRTDPETGLDSWREHGRAVHEAVTGAELARHDGVVVARADEASLAQIEPVARLVRDYRSPEPTVLVRGGDALAVATVADGVDAAALLAEAAASTEPDADAPVHGHEAVATLPVAADQDAIVRAVRRQLR